MPSIYIYIYILFRCVTDIWVIHMYLNTDYMNRKMDLGHFCYVLLFHVTETTWGVSASNV